MRTEMYEQMHRTNIDNLIQEFGKGNERKIRDLYEQQREIIEENAKLNDYIPLLTYEAVKKALNVK